jgi:hypothetical protein
MGSVVAESAAEFFKEQVEGALAHQRLDAGELTAFYVVNLLTGFLQRSPGGPGVEDGEPLALQLVAALSSGGAQQRATLRQIGDVSLFVAGFFSDSLRRKLVDVDYYAKIGGFAYGSLSHADTDALAPVFDELARKFVAFADVLAEVSERAWCSSNVDLLRLYEKWLKTGSSRSGRLLLEHGVMPCQPAVTPSIH